MNPDHQLIAAARNGDEVAAGRLHKWVDDAIRPMVRGRTRHEKATAAYQTTELIDRAFLEMLRNPAVTFEDRQHVVRLAGRIVQNELINAARKRRTAKRGRGWVRAPMPDVSSTEGLAPEQLLALSEALESLENHDPDRMNIVRLRYLLGMTNAEAADLLGIPESTAHDRWEYARAWLRREMNK